MYSIIYSLPSCLMYCRGRGGGQSSYFTMGYKAEITLYERQEYKLSSRVDLCARVGTEIFKLVEGIPSTDQNHSGMQN